VLKFVIKKMKSLQIISYLSKIFSLWSFFY
jgi:hypothetical protein